MFHRRASLFLRTLAALSALLLLCVRLAAEPFTFPTLTTTQGVTYREVKVTRFDAIEVRFIHATGAATVPLADLPADLQKVFGYDPRKASAVMADKHEGRVKTIITEADKKARAAALQEQERADAAELKTIAASALRCHVNHVNVSDEALLIEVSPADKLPLKLKSRNGKYERVKLTPQGKPELVEQIVPDQSFILGDTLRILPKSAPITGHSFISVYLIGTDVGTHPLCALTAEDAQRYRKKLAALKAAEPPAPTEPAVPATAPIEPPRQGK
jgi:hypothetical protein